MNHEGSPRPNPGDLFICSWREDPVGLPLGGSTTFCVETPGKRQLPTKVVWISRVGLDIAFLVLYVPWDMLDSRWRAHSRNICYIKKYHQMLRMSLFNLLDKMIPPASTIFRPVHVTCLLFSPPAASSILMEKNVHINWRKVIFLLTLFFQQSLTCLLFSSLKELWMGRAVEGFIVPL